MFKSRNPIRLFAANILLFTLSVSALCQQSPTPTLTPAQTRQINKVMKKLGHFDPGTKLDIQLNDGSHQIGKVSNTGSTSFILVDSVSGKTQTIDYFDVKRVQPTRKEYAVQQLNKTTNALPKIAVAAVLIVAALCILALVSGDR
jgi:hypothetical protein